MNEISIYIFIVGLCIGSFLNVCIDRVSEERSIIWPPSHCESCGYNLKVKDLIPVVSYIFLKGRCRKCKEKLSIQYPLIEIINACLYLALYYRCGLNFYLIKNCVLISILLIMTVIDIKTKNVYTKVSISLIASGVLLDIYECMFLQGSISSYIYATLISFIVFISIVKGTNAMGQGDVEVAVGCSLFLGIKYSIVSILSSFILGGVISVMLIVFKIKDRKDEIAFVPYLALGSYISVFLGDVLINWYFNCY